MKAAYSKGILLVLACAFLARLIHVDAPILGVHSWRQADTAAFARNYVENGFHFLYPQVDWGGATAGHVESEFPIYSFLVALLYGMFGINEALGRLLSATCFVVATYALFLLARREVDDKTAFFAALTYTLIPLNLYYSRTVMPEAMMLMASILAVYFFPRRIFASAFFLAIACLLKPPAFYLGLPLLYLAFREHGRAILKRRDLWLHAAFVLVAFTLWYAHAHRVGRDAGRSFGIWEYGQDKWGNWSLVASGSYWHEILFKRLAEDNLTWLGFGLVVVGLALPRKGRLFDFWLAGVLIYFAVVGKGNEIHEYYQLPFLIPAAFFIGIVYGRYFDPRAAKARSAVLAACLVGIGVEGFRRYEREYLAREIPERSPELHLAERVRALTEPNARLVVLARGDPTLFYLAHRKGWKDWPEGELTRDHLAELAREGARYLVGCRYLLTTEAERTKLEALLARSESLLPADDPCFVVRLTPDGSR